MAKQCGRLESAARDPKSGGGRHRTAMLKVAALMVQEEVDNASPKP